MSEDDRFWAKVNLLDPSGCWRWTGAKNHKGYGHIKIRGHMIKAHRWAYEHLVAPLLPDITIDHLCHTRDCVNPAHMEPVTRSENGLRGFLYQIGADHV